MTKIKRGDKVYWLDDIRVEEGIVDGIRQASETELDVVFVRGKVIPVSVIETDLTNILTKAIARITDKITLLKDIRQTLRDQLNGVEPTIISRKKKL